MKTQTTAMTTTQTETPAPPKRSKAPWIAALALAGALLLPTAASARPAVFFHIAPVRAVVWVKPAPKVKPVVIRPAKIKTQKKVWIKGHWKKNRFGRRVWVKGHWAWVRR